MNQLVHVQAHRGASKEAIENTLASVLRAAELGVDSIEIDVQVLKDGTPILFHDFVVPAKGFVTDFNLEELSKVEWTDPLFKIPTLSEVLKGLNQIPEDQRPILDIELKYDPTNPSGPSRDVILEKVLAEVVREHSQEQVAYRSFDWELLKLLLKKSPRAQVIPLVSDKEKNWDEILKWRTAWIAPSVRHLKSEWLKKARAQNTKIMAYTANTVQEWERLIALGVEGITTDYPRELIQFLRNQKA